MTTKVVPGVLIATPDVEQVGVEAAARMARTIRDAIDARGSAAIALSGGNTPRAAYGKLAKEKIDWSKVDVFWVDERACAPTDDRSNYRWAKSELVDPAKIPADRVHRMPADAKDLAAAAKDYDALVRAKVRGKTKGGTPAFDLMILGIGDDGHTASLFPGETTIDVTEALVTSVPAKGAREARMTLTVPAIEAARSIIVLAVGAGKNGPLERVWLVEGDPHDTPARVIRGARGSVAWIIDRAAGGL